MRHPSKTYCLLSASRAWVLHCLVDPSVRISSSSSQEGSDISSLRSRAGEYYPANRTGEKNPANSQQFLPRCSYTGHDTYRGNSCTGSECPRAALEGVGYRLG